MPKIADFYAEFLIKGDTLTLKDMVGMMSSLNISSVAEIGALASLAAGFAAVTTKAVTLSSEYAKLTAVTGISAQEIQKWQYAAVASNISAESMANAFGKLSSNLAAFKLGKGSNEVISSMAWLGYTQGIQLDPVEFIRKLPDLVRNFARTHSKAETAYLLQSLMGDSGMIQLFSKSNAEIAKSMVGPRISNEDIKAWTEFGNHLASLGRAMMFFAVNQLHPLTRYIKDFDDAVDRLKEIMGYSNNQNINAGARVLSDYAARDLAGLNHQTPGGLLGDLISAVTGMRGVEIHDHSTTNLTHSAEPVDMLNAANRAKNDRYQKFWTQIAQQSNQVWAY